jgi:signal transduction histidine kinase/ligand-binding sensor domain-containing protein
MAYWIGGRPGVFRVRLIPVSDGANMLGIPRPMGWLKRTSGWNSMAVSIVRRGCPAWSSWPSRFSARFRASASLLWLLLLPLIGSPAFAQYRFDVWTADDGLPQNVIRGIQQTADGYLWIATFDGLVRFDGIRFTAFNRSNTPGLASNRFGSIYEAKNGDLWMTTELGGVTRYRDGVFQTFGQKEGIPGNVVLGLTGDDLSRIWILTARNVAQWDEAAGKFVDAGVVSPGARYQPFTWERSGLWSADKAHLICFIDGRSVTYPLPSWLPGNSIWGAASDGEGTIWIETLNGAHARLARDGTITGPFGRDLKTSFADGQGHTWTIDVGERLTRSMTYTSDGSPATLAFHTIFEDREKNLWLGSEGQGLFRGQPASIHVYSKEQGLIDRNIYPIYQDHEGAVWIGAWHRGLSRFYNGKFTSFPLSEVPNAKLATGIVEDHRGTLWVGTHGGLLVYQGGKFRAATAPLLPDGAIVQAIYEDRRNTLWIGTSRGLLSFKDGITQIFRASDGLAADDVRVITESKSGDLWVGGYGGLTRLHSGQFTHWTGTSILPSNNVRTIYIDNDNIVWIGTYDGGLGRFDGEKFTRYGTADGLFNDGVFQILEDGRGNLWMSCNRGIYRVRKQELNEFAAGKRTEITSVPYGKVDGLLNVECNGGLWPAGVKTKDGMLWFPTQDGVAVIDPQAVSINPEPPPVMIESLEIDRSPVRLDGSVKVAPGKENLEIRYTALSFIKSEQIHFRYRLQGLDSKWIDAGSRRTAYYSHIPPGSYTFQVIAENSDGVWNNEGKSLELTVLAPFYRTPWFQGLMLLAIGAMVLLAWRYRVLQLEQTNAAQQAFSRQLIASQENERKRIAAELHDSLGQRLVVIKNLALFVLRSSKAPEGSEAMTIAEISEEAQSAINETREISYNLRPFQLDRLGLTKAIESMVRTTGNASGIRFTTEVDNIDDLFPEEQRITFYRIIQESLSNIMKHAEASEVRLTIKRGPQGLALTMQDNGRGFEAASRGSSAANSGFGLTGMAERAKLLGGQFAVHSTRGQGTTMSVEIPSKGASHG